MNLKNKYFNIVSGIILALSWLIIGCSKVQKTAIFPGSRTLLDAHNCYPYEGKWVDRIDRALESGTPLAIEQDLVWFTDSLSGASWSIVSHGEPYSGKEPILRTYFFERIRPIVENTIENSNKKNWPVISLNLDFKTNEPEHHIAIWELLGEYEEWLCTAERVSDVRKVMAIDVKPVLVLSGSNDSQERIFHDSVDIGKKLRVFGAVYTHGDSVEVTPEKMVPHGANNYRRWWNNPWKVVEKNIRERNKQWSGEDLQRLRSLVEHAHKMGLWIRFYTLNGYNPDTSLGWFEDYNLGSEKKVKIRWRAVIETGVDFVATDQYEQFADFKAELQNN